jgi:hypothetical protein
MDAGLKVLNNINNHVPYYTIWHSSRTQFLTLPLCMENWYSTVSHASCPDRVVVVLRYFRKLVKKIIGSIGFRFV